MYEFEFEKPSTIADAVKALGEEDAQALGGGQTLIPTLKQRLAMPSTLVSLSGIAEMRGVCPDGDAIAIGGATTHAEVEAATTDSYPALSALAGKLLNADTGAWPLLALMLATALAAISAIVVVIRRERQLGL